MPVKLSSTGGGSVTLTTPSTASDFTVTIPAATGTMVTTTSASTIEFAAGSAAAPSITTTGDTNTGIFFPAADTVAISAAGAEDFRIGPAGQIGLQGANYGTSGQVLTSNGSGSAPSWQAAGGGQIQSQTFYSSGSWTAPAGVTKVRVLLTGGGGGGGGGVASGTAPPCTVGGMGGAVLAAVNVTPGTAYTITVGSGGTGGAHKANSPGNNGASGGTTSFGALVSCTGGLGGRGSGVSGNPTNGTDTVTGTVIRTWNNGAQTNANTQNRTVINASFFAAFGYGNSFGVAAAIAATATGSIQAGSYGGAGSDNCPQAAGSGGANGMVYLEWVGA